jgi:RNA polymerase sigma-70 factor (ECF subfamily)
MSAGITETDDQLIQGCREGNRLSQKRLYERYFGKGMGTAMRYMGNYQEAMEVVNTAFCKILTSLDKYESGNFGGWVTKIVFNVCIDQIRSKNRFHDVPVDKMPESEPIQNEALDHMNTEELFQLIQKLHPTQRAVFSLFVIDGYSHEEIGEILGITSSTSRSSLAYARNSLKKMLTDTTEKKSNQYRA